MSSTTSRRDAVRVSSLDDLAFLVKEREILTGRSGRDSFVAGADGPAWHVEIDRVGYRVARVDADAPSDAAWLGDLSPHAIGTAMDSGLLYTTALQ